jgi:hypothetical protein
MELVEATVTTATATELRLIANWPIVWLQAIGSFEIEDKLAHDEIFERPDPGELTQRMELNGNRANWPHLKVGDRVLVRCYLVNEPR